MKSKMQKKHSAMQSSNPMQNIYGATGDLAQMDWQCAWLQRRKIRTLQQVF